MGVDSPDKDKREKQDNLELYSDEVVKEFLALIDVRDIGISDRVVRLLKQNRINTLLDLCETDIFKFTCNILGLGPEGQKEVFIRMAQLGLRFKFCEDNPYERLIAPNRRQNYNTEYNKVDISKILDIIMDIEKESGQE